MPLDVKCHYFERQTHFRNLDADIMHFIVITSYFAIASEAGLRIAVMYSSIPATGHLGTVKPRRLLLLPRPLASAHDFLSLLLLGLVLASAQSSLSRYSAAMSSPAASSPSIAKRNFKAIERQPFSCYALAARSAANEISSDMRQRIHGAL